MQFIEIGNIIIHTQIISPIFSILGAKHINFPENICIVKVSYSVSIYLTISGLHSNRVGFPEFSLNKLGM